MITTLYALAALAGLIPGAQVDPAVTGPDDSVAQVEEDSPMWDCRVHGNRVCGPDATVPVRVGRAVVQVPVSLAGA